MQEKIKETASELFYSKENQEYLRRSLEQYRRGELTEHELIEE